MTTYWDQMFNYASAATTLTQMYAGTTSSQGTYSPKANGALQKLCIVISPQAATSLAQSGYAQLTCTAWSPVNTSTFPFGGFSLQTISSASPTTGNNEQNWFPPIGDGYLNWPVSTAIPISGSVIYFYSPVTPNIVVYGLFSA